MYIQHSSRVQVGRFTQVVIALLLMILLADGGAMAQSSSPSPATDGVGGWFIFFTILSVIFFVIIVSECDSAWIAMVDTLLYIGALTMVTSAFNAVSTRDLFESVALGIGGLVGFVSAIIIRKIHPEFASRPEADPSQERRSNASAPSKDAESPSPDNKS